MKNEITMKIITTKTEQIISPHEVHDIILKKAKNILEETGVPTNKEIIIKEIKGEDSCSVFRIDCGDSTYALKVFSDSKNASQFYVNKTFNRLATENNIPTPKIIHSSNELKTLPVPWIVWEWFPGKPSYGIESKRERRNAAVQAGIILRRIHEIKMPGFGYPNSKNTWSGENIRWTIDFFIKRIQNLNKKGGSAFLDNELSDFFNVTAESKELLSFSEPHLLHGDITGGNVLVSDLESITIIDPGEIIAGDPMSDLGYSQTTGLSPIFREGIWEGYTKNNPLTEKEYSRFLRWRLLRQCIIACRAVLDKDENAGDRISDAQSFLQEILKK